MDCSPWNSPGQNTGVASHSLSQRIFPTRDQTQVSHIAGGFFTSLAPREAQNVWVLGKSFHWLLNCIEQENENTICALNPGPVLSYHGNFVSCSNFILTVFRTLVWSKMVLWPNKKKVGRWFGFQNAGFKIYSLILVNLLNDALSHTQDTALQNYSADMCTSVVF